MDKRLRGYCITVSIVFTALVSACGADRAADLAEDENLPPQEEDSAQEEPSEAVSFIAFGDWGDESDGQLAVSKAIEGYCASERCDFIVTLGDNFQDEGVISADDPLWQTTFRDVYGDLGIPFQAALGNHDVKGNIQAQIDYSDLNPMWNMEGEYYSFAEPEACCNPVIEFFIINTGDDEYQPNEREWLKGAIAASDATWKILVSHKPILSNGSEHGDTGMENGEELIGDICGKIDLVLSGHDHIFSYLVGESLNFDVGCEMSQLVIGTGGGDLYEFDAADPRAIETGSFSGFGWFEAKSDSLIFRMIDTDEAVFYTKTWERP